MMKDFFISYTGSDVSRATWVAELLESKGKTVIIQEWDFNAGENFVHNINQGLITCRQMIVILSNKYLTSYWCEEEWTSKLKEQVETQERKIIPIRVEPINPKGLLGPISYIDIVDKTQEEAEKTILEEIKEEKERIAKEGFVPYYNVEHLQIDLDYLVKSNEIVFIKTCKTHILKEGLNSIHNRITWFQDENVELIPITKGIRIETLDLKDTNLNYNVVFDRRFKKGEIVSYRVKAILQNKNNHFENFFSTEVITPIGQLNMHLSLSDTKVKHYYTQKLSDSPMNVRTESPVKHDYFTPSHWYIEKPELHFEYKIFW